MAEYDIKHLSCSLAVSVGKATQSLVAKTIALFR